MQYKVNENIKTKGNFLESILTARGVSNLEDYLKPSRFAKNNPFSLKNMEQGVLLLLDHLKRKSRIHIIVDCDGDGVTSAAELFLYLQKHYPDVEITWSMHEGKQHGIEMDKLDTNIDLLIIPDAGSNQYEEHKQLSEMGIDILVLDHHEAEKESEYAVIINNQLCDYPNKSLTGAGVVFKFLEAIDIIEGHSSAEDFLDLAAVGIIGDMADLRDLETRWIVYEGLGNLKNFGLQSFVQKQAFSIGDISKLSPISIAFYITPLINAIIRVGTMAEKETLFKAFIDGRATEPSTKRGAKPGDTEIIAEKAARLATNCRNRQNKLLDEAIDYIRFKIEKEDLNQNRILLITLEDDEVNKVRSELTGLVAMKISQEFNKPTLIGKRSGDSFKGSGRGLNNSQLDDFRQFVANAPYSEFAEGHAQAFGFGIKANFIDEINSYTNEKLANYDFGETFYEVDYVFEDEYQYLDEMAFDIDRASSIWGRGVDEPKVVVRNIHFTSKDVSIMGKTKETTKITIGDINFIKFKDINFANEISNLEFGIITVVGRVGLNEWMGRRNPQVFIEDYELINDDKGF